MEHLDPIAASIDKPIRSAVPTTVRFHDLVIKNPKVVAYLESIPSEKREVALQHALEVGVIELVSRRERLIR